MERNATITAAKFDRNETAAAPIQGYECVNVCEHDQVRHRCDGCSGKPSCRRCYIAVQETLSTGKINVYYQPELHRRSCFRAAYPICFRETINDATHIKHKRYVLQNLAFPDFIMGADDVIDIQPDGHLH